MLNWICAQCSLNRVQLHLTYLSLALFAFSISLKISQFIDDEKHFPSVQEYLSYKPAKFRFIRYLSVLIGTIFSFGAIALFPRIQSVSAWDDFRKFAPLFLCLLAMIVVTYISLRTKIEGINRHSSKNKKTIFLFQLW